MARKPKEPAISADLGRPETPEETAARKAEQSRLYRQRKTVNNLIYSLLVTVGLALVIFLLVPHADSSPNWAVDYQKIAKQVQASVDKPLVTPLMNSSWRANQAKIRMNSLDKIAVWQVGFITPSDTFISYRQALSASSSWTASMVKDLRPTGEKVIAGITWQVFNNRSAEQPGNLAYALATVKNGVVFLLNGSASDADFDALASNIATQLSE